MPDWRNTVGDTLQWVHGPAVAAIASGALLAFSDASHEVLLSFAKEVLEATRHAVAWLTLSPDARTKHLVALNYDPSLDRFVSVSLRVVLGLLIFFAVPMAIWNSARAVLLNSSRTEISNRRPAAKDAVAKDLVWMPRVLAGVPLLGAVTGCIATATSGEATVLQYRMGWEQAILFLMAATSVLYLSYIPSLSADGYMQFRLRKEAYILTGLLLLVGGFSFFDTFHQWIGLYYTNSIMVFISGALLLSYALILKHIYGYKVSRTEIAVTIVGTIIITGFFGYRAFDAFAQDISVHFDNIEGLSILGIYNYMGSYQLEISRNVGKFLESVIHIALPTALVLLSIFYIRWDRGNFERRPESDEVPISFWVQAFVAVSIITIVVLSIAIDLRFWFWFGSLAIESLFVMCFATVTALITIASVRWFWHLPINMLLLGGAILWFPMGLSGNHPILGVALPTDPPAMRSASEAYVGWRSDPGRREALAVRKPVLVAAQGGGLFAAYHTAYYLAKRADEDPTFSDRLFAISAVSGGSIGAGVFWAIEKSHVCDDVGGDCRRRAVRRILRRDYLTPVLTGLAFSDFFDTFFPVLPWVTDRRIERGAALESAISDAVGHETGVPGLLDMPMAGSWRPHESGPLLFLNSTVVQTGDRLVFSPVFEFGGGSGSRTLLFDNKEISVVNAMVMSARFPLVTPPGQLRFVGTDNAIQIVDGGYYDNSGIETLREVIRDIQLVDGEARVEVVLFEVREREGDPQARQGFLGAPISTFLNAWRARRDLSVLRFCEDVVLPGVSRTVECDIDALGGSDGNVAVTPARLDARDFDFTLSWLLTDRTFCEIERQVGEVRNCVAN